MSRTAADKHIIQLFDSPESRAAEVAGFVAEGLSAGEAVLTVITPTNWCSVAKRLLEQESGFEAAIGSSRLVVMDAASVLSKLLVAGIPDSTRFESTIATGVRRLHRRYGRLRVYGELVDLLAAESDFVGARQLESLWNRLLASCAFTLFCGYSAVHFGDPRSASELRLICECHSGFRTTDDDELGAWLVRTATSDHASYQKEIRSPM